MTQLALFDLDHTLLKANCSFRFGVFLYRHRFFSFFPLFNCLIDYARHKWLGMSIEALHHRTFAHLFQAKAVADIQQYVDQFLNESLETLLFPPVLGRLREAQDRGDCVVILSSSPDFLVREIARRLNVSLWGATTYKTISETPCETRETEKIEETEQPQKKERLNGIAQVMEGEDKGAFLRDLLLKLYPQKLSPTSPFSLPKIIVYSDSHLDLSILKMADEAIGVRPDRYLKNICLQNGWEIL